VSQWTGIQHSQCMQLRMLLEQRKTFIVQYVVTTTDLMFRKLFDLWWFDKLHVEMDLMWFWRQLWWILFVGCLNKSWLLLQNSNCKWATVLSILVIIVYFSVTLSYCHGRRRAGASRWHCFPGCFNREATGAGRANFSSQYHKEFHG